jgi:hypothetical protein
MSSSYSSKLRDARWQRKRLEVMERDNWTCRSCGAAGEGVTLNVHHAYYESGKNPWDYEDDMLFTFCDACHAQIHESINYICKHICAFSIAGINGYKYAAEQRELWERSGELGVFPLGVVMKSFDLFELGKAVNDVR